MDVKAYSSGAFLKKIEKMLQEATQDKDVKFCLFVTNETVTDTTRWSNMTTKQIELLHLPK